MVKAYKKMETKKPKVKKEMKYPDRYFELKGIKQEEEGEEEDEEEVSQRIWDTENDTKIIDKDIDEISDDESADLDEDESDSDMESQIIQEQTLANDKKENVSQSGALKARKRKSSSGSVEEVEPVSLSKKTKQVNGNEEAASATTKKKRKGNNEGCDSDGSKRKKTSDNEEKEMVDLASAVEDESSSQRTSQTLKTPGFMWDIDPTKFMQVCSIA